MEGQMRVSRFELLHATLEVIDVDGTGEVGLFGFLLSLKTALKHGQHAMKE
jgi:hypothetical protein